MSDSPLPEDLARWPSDPYELLGVQPGVPPRDLRRVYARLIRAFKPEQFPEHFRRIREAYETVLRHAEWFSFEEAPADDPPGAPAPPAPHGDESPPTPEEIHAPLPHPEPEPAAEEPPERPVYVPTPEARRRAEDDADSLWELAVSGEEARAYDGLRRLHDLHPERPALAVRLYWLLAVNPELDPASKPGDWLAVALRVSGLSGPSLELYRRELEAHPIDALGPAFAGILEADAGPYRVGQVAAWRWRAAAKVGRWDVIRADLPAARERVAPEEEAWVQLLFAVLDELVWEAGRGPAGVLLGEVLGEVKRHEHLALRRPDGFDRLDFLQEAAAAWRKVCDRRRLPADLLRLLRDGWSLSFAEVRPLLLRVLADMERSPQEWLGHFDWIERRARAALAHFGRMLALHSAALPSPPDCPYPTEVLARMAREFFDAHLLVNYASARGELLDFCLRESVGPEWLASVAPHRPADRHGASLGEALAGDWPLRYVCHAVRLFWAS